MRERHRVLTWATVLIVMTALSGCVGARHSTHSGGAMIPITDVASVAGTWTGVVSRVTGSAEGDWVEVNVKENGTFEAVSARQIGALLGSGTLTVTDGRIQAAGPHGTALLTLYDRQGRALVMDFRDRSGVRYSAELRPKM
jgi:hypothetical protein